MHNDTKKSGINSVMKNINSEFEEREVELRAKKLGFPYINLQKIVLNPDVFSLISPDDSVAGKIVPYLLSGDKLYLALANPADKKAKQIIDGLNKKYEVFLHLASNRSISQAQKLYKSPQYSLPKKEELEVEDDLSDYEAHLKTLAGIKEEMEKIETSEINKILLGGAVQVGASDVHFQPEENGVIIRFRVDGVLLKVTEVSKKKFLEIMTEIKYKAKMKLNISSVPQDGQYHITVNKRKIKLRVSTLPTEFGETAVIRILDPKHNLVSFEELGFSSFFIKRMYEAMKTPMGMILVTGPTGSGKTTTLYSMLSRLSTGKNKVVTLEDPIEFNLPNISQSQVKEEEGYDFKSGFRALLRQDPDVIMVGEIRDPETAEVASQAALTGHIVLSTLHTNNAAESIARLINLNLQPFVIAPAINAVIAQRLVRRLCKCAVTVPIKIEEKKEIEKVIAEIKNKGIKVSSVPDRLRYPKGCNICSSTGYRRQLAIAEILVFDDNIKSLVLNGAKENEILSSALENGMLTMREEGILKVLEGKTTMSEVWRVV